MDRTVSHPYPRTTSAMNGRCSTRAPLSSGTQETQRLGPCSLKRCRGGNRHRLSWIGSGLTPKLTQMSMCSFRENVVRDRVRQGRSYRLNGLPTRSVARTTGGRPNSASGRNRRMTQLWQITSCPVWLRMRQVMPMGSGNCIDPSLVEIPVTRTSIQSWMVHIRVEIYSLHGLTSTRSAMETRLQVGTSGP